ncbi:MAG TPA: hypothetical protein VE783_05610 [Candidatus Limnocylindrales bacterium]|nr:hypothetical protein [Candidatus Limnocylindrales bacterium]
MTFFKDIKSVVREDRNTSLSSINKDNPLFVFVIMPGDIDVEDRWNNFQDPLDEALTKADLGCVTGGGSADGGEDDLAEPFSGVDVDLYDAAKGIEFLRQELVRLKAPPGTIMTYELEGREWEDPVYPPKPS